MTIHPVRLQHSRRKGAHLVSPNGLPIKRIYRGTRYGNRFKIGMPSIELPFIVASRFKHELGATLTREDCLEAFEIFLTLEIGRELKERIKRDLRGCNVACCCGLNQACHGDIELRVANE